MKTPVIHYAGGVRTARMMILGGWAACCSGDKAERIKMAGNNTIDPRDVTCKACLRVMDKDESIKSIFGIEHEDPCALGHE